jgi:predicted enzyme related to lactoylglutathione lyase
MDAKTPAEVPSNWTVYFGVDDVDAAFQRVIELGGRELFAPQDFPGGRFAIVTDPQGAAFGLLKTQQ